MRYPRKCARMPLFALLCCAVFVGCSSDGAATGTVKGQITYNSQPVTAGMVIYENASKGWIGASELDTEGRYRIPDIRLADYVVSVQPPTPKTPSESDGSIEEIKAKMVTYKVPDPANIPRPVRTTQSSPLKASVTEGDQEFNFDLSKTAGS